MNVSQPDKNITQEIEFPYLSISDYFQFPPANEAEKSGLVAQGGNMSPGMLFSAYLQGIFPWFNEEDPVLWWSPNPRFVLLPEELHIPTRFRRYLKTHPFTFKANTNFEQVIAHCAQVKREGQKGTWITEDIQKAYCEFHRLGYAHSFEAYKDNELIGGFYGVLIGSIFFGESMFTLEPDAAKATFCHFVKCFVDCGGKLIDSQIYTDNIARFGGKNISRDVFLRLEQEYLPQQLEKNLITYFNDTNTTVQ